MAGFLRLAVGSTMQNRRACSHGPLSAFPVRASPSNIPLKASRIQRQPLYHSLNELIKLLNTNAASVPCTISTGDFGWIALTISPALYQTLAGAPFAFPINPGHAPNIPNFATATQIEAIRVNHKEALPQRGQGPVE
jgi:hypothetical protein